MLTIDNLVKAYGSDRGGKALLARRGRKADGGPVLAVNGVGFEVREGELFTLLGPSGCGKTTTLRAVAGLERPEAGTITLAGRVLFDAQRRVNVPANRRGIGMVFQSYAIWPHLSVFRNVAFPFEVMPRASRPGRSEIRERVDRVLDITGLSAFADRSATKLSGGQQQRLALARAMVTEPPLLLLDEPLSNLDAKLRESMRFELKRLQRELGLTTIYVTHDQAEALVLSSRIAVMRDGEIMQVGKPREVYTDPTNKFVAEFIGVSNFIDGVVGESSRGHTRIETDEGALWTSREHDLQLGAEVVVSLRPESLEIGTQRPADARNQWRGNVVTRAFLGDSADYVVSVGKLELRVRCNPSVSVPPGTEVHLTVPPEQVIMVRRWESR